jgi:hypothetical protein
MPRRFTVDEARLVLPRAGRLLRTAIARKAAFDQAQQSIQEVTDRVTRMGGMMVDRDRALEANRRRDAAVAQLREVLQELQSLGCVVKDLDTGLIDFPTLFRGVEVYLCWKLGEDTIGFWHGVEEGFRGRRPIDQDFLDHHQGDRPE